MWLFLLIILFNCDIVINDFSPDTSDYDAYGLKIAANDVLFVEANGKAETFLIQFAPYNYTFGLLQCSIPYDDPAHYVYSVGVGINQTSTLNPYFYFAGEVVPQGLSTTDRSGKNGTFIGVWINRDNQSVQNYVNNRQPLSCNYFQAAKLEFLSSYGHQEFFVLAVEPNGNYAIGLATDFVFIYQPFPNSMITTKSSSVVWPNSATFNPWAADTSGTFTIVAGFVANSARSRVYATPTVYLISNTNLTVLSTWSYSATNNSWQSRLTYSNVGSWSDKYTMSVKINFDDPSRALVGMAFLNTVFLFSITNNGTNLILASSMSNGQSVGFGKSVTWLTQVQAAILVSTYSLNYLTWYSSNIYVYTSLNGTILPSLPTAVIPNAQQPLPSTINSKLIQIISTPESLAVLDIVGGVVLILAEPPGYYASTDTNNSPVAASMPVISHQMTCIAGTYKSDTGVHPCVLCPSGSRNPGGVIATSCISCSSTSFCPLGAVYDMDPTCIASISQAYAYPRSPDMIIFEDILLVNMFSLGSTSHCLIVSPIFWTLIFLAIFLLLFVFMASMNCYVQKPKRDRWRTRIKNVFRKTDLVREGELWIGGLASIIIIMITAMGCTFAISYLYQYPSEKVGPSSFACDVTIRNAKFESGLQALAVPFSDEEQPIYTLLNEQNFTLQIDFVNTNASCMELSISKVTDSSTINLKPLSCTNINGILSMRVFLPQHDITIEAVLNSIELVGGMRLGLSGSDQENEFYSLQELNFIQSFYSSSQTLSQQATINMALTKVVNKTEPLSGSDSDFAGIWYPTFTYSVSQMFIDATSYVMSADLTSMTFTIVISETSYYVKNVQSPIAKEPEIIFHTILFAIVCLEICGLIFVICKLFVIPLFYKIYALYFGRRMNKVDSEHDSMTDAPHRHSLPRPKSSAKQKRNSRSSTLSFSFTLAPTSSTIREAFVVGKEVSLRRNVRITPEPKLKSNHD